MMPPILPRVGRLARSRRPRVSALLTVWLVTVWVLLWGRPTWLTVGGGVLVAVLVQVAFPLPHHGRLFHPRPGAVAVLLGRFLADVVAAGWHVAWVVVVGRPHREAVVRCRLRSSDALYVSVVTAMTSLIPGTIALEVDDRRRVLYLHCFDVDHQGGIDAVRRATLAQEARVLRALATDAELERAGLARRPAGGGGRP